MDPILILALATFALILGYLIWNRMSVARQQKGKPSSGVGSPHDPLAGTTENMRDPDAMRADLDAAAARDAASGGMAPAPRPEP